MEIKGVHPLCAMVPEYSQDEYDRLKSNIEQNGQRKPIEVDRDGLIIDGRHRHKVCIDLNRAPKVVVTDDNPYEVVTAGITHRNLTAGQRAMIANDMRGWYDEQARERMRKGGEGAKMSSTGQARDKVGKEFGVSGRYVDLARAVNELDPKMAELVKKGQVALTAAYNAIQPEPVVVPVAQKQPKRKDCKNCGVDCNHKSRYCDKCRVSKNHYVYMWRRNRCHIRYVGKGTGQRAWQDHDELLVEDHEVIIIEDSLTENEALAAERVILKCLRNFNISTVVSLSNKSHMGGDNV